MRSSPQVAWRAVEQRARRQGDTPVLLDVEQAGGIRHHRRHTAVGRQHPIDDLDNEGVERHEGADQRIEDIVQEQIVDEAQQLDELAVLIENGGLPDLDDVGIEDEDVTARDGVAARA